MILVRDHVLRPSVDREGGKVALVAFEDASFTDLVSGAIDTMRLADVDAASGCVDRPRIDETGATILFNYNQGCYQSSFATSLMYLKPVVGGVAERMSGVARSGIGLLSADAAVVAFLSEDLGASDGDTNRFLDVYLRTVSSIALQRASLAHDGAEANAHVFLSGISGDGRYVVFETRARNVAPGLTQLDIRLLVREVATGAMARLDVPAGGDPELGIRQGERRQRQRSVRRLRQRRSAAPGSGGGEPRRLPGREPALDALTPVATRARDQSDHASPSWRCSAGRGGGHRGTPAPRR